MCGSKNILLTGINMCKSVGGNKCVTQLSDTNSELNGLTPVGTVVSP